MIAAAQEAEEILGHPPTIIEMFFILEKNNFSLPVRDPFIVAAIITTLLREDMVFVDKICYRWSARKREGFYNFTELMQINYGTANQYGLLNGKRIVAQNARTVNYSLLSTILKSRDPEHFDQNQWIWDGSFRFLDQTEKMGLGGHCNHI